MQSSSPPSDPRVEYWTKQAFWPHDLPTHIFLGRVVGRVGEAVFGTDWTGREPAVELVAPLPEALHASVGQSELLRGCRLLFDHDANYRARCPTYAEFLLHWPMPSDDDWARAVALAQRFSEQSRKEFNRFFEVCARLAHAFKHGTFLTGTRDFDGGVICPQDRWFWNTENFWWRFHTCQVDLADPYRAAVKPIGGAFIFVERNSIIAALQPPQEAEQPAPQPEFRQQEYFSPFVRCMIDATRALKITANDERKKDEIVAELRKYWSGAPDELTGADIEHMSTFLREPAHKKGRGRKKT